MVGATEERDVRVETPHVVAVFTNRGARLKSWRLKAYKDNHGEPLELVATELAATQPLPFSLRVADDATTGTLNGALYKVQGAVPEGVQNATTQVAFEYQDSNGVHAVKQFTLDPATYTVTMRATLSQGDRSLPATVVWGPGLGDSDSQTGRYAVKPGGLFSSGGKVTRLAARAVATQPTYDQDFEYAGVDDHYFMTVALKTGTGDAHLSAGVDSAARRVEGSRARSDLVFDRADARRAADVLRRPQGFRHAGCHRSQSHQGDQLRDLFRHRRPVACDRSTGSTATLAITAGRFLR